MDNEHEPLLRFPCQFPIKAMGKTDSEFEQRVLDLVRKHAPDTTAVQLKSRKSKAGRYTSVTITISATSREQLDAIYRDLTACKQVLMAL